MKFTIPFAPVSAARPNWSGKTGQVTKVYMPKKYAEYRRKVGTWFERWLTETDGQLLKELYRLPNGRPVRDPETNKLDPDFFGYEIKILFFVETPNPDVRPFPLAVQSSDIDNYYKACTDAIFESDSFKRVARLNDKWIQSVFMRKVSCGKGQGRTVVDLKQYQP